jgi:FAD/FMN-containing dehydrogenase/Fe-S oxidoreductase
MNNSKNHNQYQEFLTALKNSTFSGEIQTDLTERLQHAIDNSIYIETPQAVLVAKSALDIQVILQILSTKPYHQLKISCRGGGTSAVGQSLNSGLVINTRQHLNNIININKEKKEVTVEPGITLEKLNQALDHVGMYFAVQISSASAATIGGMVNTNAVGSGGLIHGRMNRHVKSIKVINHQGKEIQLNNFDLANLKKLNHDQTTKDLLKKTHSDIVSHHKEIKTELNSTSRPLSGYHLSDWINDEGICNPSSLFCGAEGTLGIISEITLKLSDKPACTTLTVVAFDDLYSPLDNAKQYLDFKPSEIELLDKKLLEAISQQSITKKLLSQHKNIFSTDTASLHYIQWQGNEENCAKNQENYINYIKKHNNYVSHIILTDEDRQEEFWALRKKAVGFIGKMSDGGRRTVPGIEDTVVPQINLGNYLRDINHLMLENNIIYSIYGHIDAGCIHIRPALDLSSNKDKALYQKLLRGVFEICDKHGGIFRGGEHGFGKLSEFNSHQLSNKLFQLMVKIKHYWDPDNRFGNDNIINNNPETDLLRERYKNLENGANTSENQFLYCNGNASCLNSNNNLLICPSYKATQELRHSPRGRSILLREWYQKKLAGKENKKFTLEVKDALSGCLSCKACISQCPLNVSIPSAKSDFLYHSGLHKSTSLFDKLSIFSESHPKISRILTRVLPEKLVTKILALWSLPHNEKNSLPKLPYPVKQDERYDLIIIPDLFSTYYQPNIVESVIVICKKLNLRFAIDGYLSVGLSHYNLGQLKEFDKVAHKLSKRIQSLQQHSNKLISLEPTIRLALNHEYRQRGHLSTDNEVIDLAKFLLNYLNHHQPEIKNSLSYTKEVILFPHCHETSLEADQSNSWFELFSWLGIKITVIQTGCCGMAGTYGLEKKNQANSTWLFNNNWQSHVDKQNDAIILATGYSCRSQAKLQQNLQILHPAEFFNTLLQHDKEKTNVS